MQRLVVDRPEREVLMRVTVGHWPGTKPGEVVRSFLLNLGLPAVFKALA